MSRTKLNGKDKVQKTLLLNASTLQRIGALPESKTGTSVSVMIDAGFLALLQASDDERRELIESAFSARKGARIEAED